MRLKHFGFLIFMVLLLIAPKFPLRGLYGLPEKSSVSMGIIGLFCWYLTYPKRIASFPKLHIYCPLFWLVLFALYAFAISLFSGSIISIIYAIQYLLYVVLGISVMHRYAHNFADSDQKYSYKILFFIATIYNAGIIVSLFTGPIYPHQVSSMFGRWGGLAIQKGVGFAENQNMAGPVAGFFLAACLFLYPGNTRVKWVLLTFFLCALLATLSRGSIFSFFLSLLFYCTLDSMKPLLTQATIKAYIFKGVVFLVIILLLLIIPITLCIYLINRPIIPALFAGFGIGGPQDVVLRDTVSRMELWEWGLNKWWTQDLSKIVWGGGFRSSMEILHGRGTWKDAHNVYITILSEFGIIGFLLFGTSLLNALVRGAHLLLIGKAQRFDKFGFLVILYLSINNMTGPYFYSPVCLFLLIFSFATIRKLHLDSTPIRTFEHNQE